MTIAIRTEHLSKIFRVGFWARKVRAVEDVSLEVKSGEIFGLLGPNGAGKTTTIKMLVGFVRPSRGVATVAGEPAGLLAPRRPPRHPPEKPPLFQFLPPRQDLPLPSPLAPPPRAAPVPPPPPL